MRTTPISHTGPEPARVASRTPVASPAHRYQTRLERVHYSPTPVAADTVGKLDPAGFDGRLTVFVGASRLELRPTVDEDTQRAVIQVVDPVQDRTLTRVPAESVLTMLEQLENPAKGLVLSVTT